VPKVCKVLALDTLKGVLNGRNLEVLHILADEQGVACRLFILEVEDDRGQDDGILRSEVVRRLVGRGSCKYPGD
ncbi:MAG: hypothetical protein ACRDI2_23110, partial [Chloroflexota bacterium]